MQLLVGMQAARAPLQLHGCCRNNLHKLADRSELGKLSVLSFDDLHDNRSHSSAADPVLQYFSFRSTQIGCSHRRAVTVF